MTVKRSALVVGQQYACWSGASDDPPADSWRIVRAEVLHTEPWYRTKRVSGYGIPMADSNPKGKGVHVLIHEGKLGDNVVGRPDQATDGIVPLGTIHMTWAEWETERARRDAAAAEREQQRQTQQQQWEQRIEAVRSRLSKAGITLHPHASPGPFDGRRPDWSLTMEEMEALASALPS